MLTVTATQAAEKIGISAASFRRAVERGELPEAAIKTRPYRWYWASIERALEKSGETAAPLADKDWLMERIRGCASR
tara:strand:- start:229 stop:459 length:231 start_codon:yes stop_codon:yes gene_type:complete